MKEMYKNPILYYILVPVVIALWPLSIWAVYLPEAESKWKSDQDQYKEAQKMIAGILKLDPDRLKSADANEAGVDFEYAPAVAMVARLCRIKATNYKLSTGRDISSGGRKSQNANVVLKDIGITKLAKFLSTIQVRWAKLQCVQLKKLAKKKGHPDRWDAELKFTYYY
ncbi:MAG: hypothetical protein ACYSW4_00680 [Planctomycetota bacterium]|jgi:hypothetical protein